MTFLRDLSGYVISKSGYLSQYSDYATSWVTEDWISGMSTDFYLLINAETCCGAHSVSYSKSVWGSLPGVKRPDRESDRLPPSSGDDKHEKIDSYLYSPYAFVAFTGASIPLL
jgi:hypothetical protein